VIRSTALVFVLLTSACVDGTGKPVSEPVFYAKNVKRYGETALGLPPDEAYGWDLGVTGDVARWRECPSIETCSNVERTRRASDVLAVERIAEANLDGRRVDVMKLSLAPRPTYIVPNFK
jgi:hypothetical protein